MCEVLDFSGARGNLAVVDIRRLKFDVVIIDTGLHLSSVMLYPSVFSVMQ